MYSPGNVLCMNWGRSIEQYVPGVSFFLEYPTIATAIIHQVIEEASRSRAGGNTGIGTPADVEAFVYPEERVVKLDRSQHVFYCSPSKDPTEQNCGEGAGSRCWMYVLGRRWRVLGLGGGVGVSGWEGGRVGGHIPAHPLVHPPTEAGEKSNM